LNPWKSQRRAKRDDRLPPGSNPERRPTPSFDPRERFAFAQSRQVHSFIPFGHFLADFRFASFTGIPASLHWLSRSTPGATESSIL